MGLDAEIRDAARAGDVARLEGLCYRAAAGAALGEPVAPFAPAAVETTARAVRNWWVSVAVDGRRPVATGPRGAEGGIYLTLDQRDKGGAVRVCTLEGYADASGSLVLRLDGRATVRTVR